MKPMNVCYNLEIEYFFLNYPFFINWLESTTWSNLKQLWKNGKSNVKYILRPKQMFSLGSADNLGTEFKVRMSTITWKWNLFF